MSDPTPSPTDEPSDWPQVRRSLLAGQRAVWFACVRGSDLHDTEHPGGVRAVKAWVQDRYATGPVRWVRVDDDTWEMRDVD